MADPIINFSLDPYGPLWRGNPSEYLEPIEDEEAASWLDHFLKGVASIGLLGFVKMVFASPLGWLNYRTAGLGGRPARPGGTGRDRMADISWVVVLVGVATFMWVSDGCPRLYLKPNQVKPPSSLTRNRLFGKP